MCIILLAYSTDPRFELVVAANRDEFHDRPTESAAFWDDDPRILAGRDLLAGGTWMGVSVSGRFAAITNYRDPAAAVAPSSRGTLVASFLTGSDSTSAYLEKVRGSGGEFSGFGLFVFDGESLGYYSNRGDDARILDPGLYGLSNHLLDTPWPKVRAGKAGLQNALALTDDRSIVTSLLNLLADQSLAPNEELPETGVGLERERLLSPLFIRNEIYGTRASTVLLRKREAAVLVERSFAPNGEMSGEEWFELELG